MGKIIFRRIGGRIIPLKGGLRSGSGYISKALHRAGLNTPNIRSDVAKKIVDLRKKLKSGKNVSTMFSYGRDSNGLARFFDRTEYTLKELFSIAVPKRGLPDVVRPGLGRPTSNPKAAFRAFRKTKIRK